MFQMQAIRTSLRSRPAITGKVRRIVGGLIVATIAGSHLLILGVPTAAAADNDPRIFAAETRCLSGGFPEIAIAQPFVYGNRSTPEKIYWKPYLQQRTSTGWVNVLVSQDWLTFSATNQGSYQPFAIPWDFRFYPSVRNAEYRVANLVFWSSTGEYGSKLSKSCVLR